MILVQLPSGQVPTDYDYSPPSTPDSDASRSQPVRGRSRQKNEGIKKRRDATKMMREENMILKEKLRKEEQKKEKYKKRYQRTVNIKSDPLTPRSKTRKLLQQSTSDAVRKKLIFHEILIDTLKYAYKSSKTERRKQLFTHMICSKLFKKFRIRNLLKSEIGLTSSIIKSQSGKLPTDTYGRHIISLSSKLRKSVTNERDDVSRMTSGKKDTKTFGGHKKPRRILNESLKSLHLKYRSEYPVNKISYATLCTPRPFWVAKPTQSDRDTCLCRLHANTAYLVSAVKAEFPTIVENNDAEQLLDHIVCSTTSKKCMDDECSKCKEKWFEIPKHDNTVEITYPRWQTKRELRSVGKSQEKMVTITVNEPVVQSVGTMMDRFREHMQKFRKHIFNIRNQYSFWRQRTEDLKENECLVHIDFSENYVCKLSSEIQSMHFGASQVQVTLHTGVLHVGGESSSYCSLSNSLQHGPAAIWVHLKPVIQDIKQQHPDIDVLHICSDGPTTQYRQKGNFCLFANVINDGEFKKATWNFMEAGHGKGAPDGIGAAVKRSCDQAVLHGSDIRDAKYMFNIPTSLGTKVKLYLIDDTLIDKAANLLESVTAIPIFIGTMGVHQVLSDSEDCTLKFRSISCRCTKGPWCYCHNPKTQRYPILPGLRFNGEVSSSLTNRGFVCTPPTDVKECGDDLERGMPPAAYISTTDGEVRV